MRVKVKTVEEMLKDQRYDEDNFNFDFVDEMRRYCGEIIELDEYNMYDGFTFSPYMYEVIGENKMTNKEFYKDKLVDIFMEGNTLAIKKSTLEPCVCDSDIECGECYRYNGGACYPSYIKKWGEMQYVEPKIEIGDEVRIKDNKGIVCSISPEKDLYVIENCEHNKTINVNTYKSNEAVRTGKHYDLYKLLGFDNE